MIADDEFLSSSAPKVNLEGASGYFLLSLLPLLCTSIVYYSVYNMSIEDYWILYALVIFGSSSMLTLGLVTLEQGSLARLNHSRGGGINANLLKKLNISKESADKIQTETTTLEATSWAFFIVNFVFAITFLFIAFYVLTWVPEIYYNYTASNLIAAAAAWQLASAMSK